MKLYPIKECFVSLQGEGVRAGEASIFLRFAGCNLRCKKIIHGFDCDTDFNNGIALTLDEILETIGKIKYRYKWVILTGGEPTLFLDADLIISLREKYRVAIETNGTIAIPYKVDWLTVSPKRGEILKIKEADEIKVVLADNDPLPDLGSFTASHYFVSPAFEGTQLPEKNLEYCIQLCLLNPKWKLTMQYHKIWKIR